MDKDQNIHLFLSDLKIRFLKELPKVKKQVKLYEKRAAEGKLSKLPTSSPQFNG